MPDTDPFLAALVDAVRKMPPEWLLELVRSALEREASAAGDRVAPRAARPRRPAKAAPRGPVAKKPAPAKRRAAVSEAVEAIEVIEAIEELEVAKAEPVVEAVVVLPDSMPEAQAENSNGRRWVKYRRPARLTAASASERFVVPEE